MVLAPSRTLHCPCSVCPTPSSLFDLHAAETLYRRSYVRYEESQPVPIFSFSPFPSFYPYTGTGSHYLDRTLVGFLVQHPFKQASM